MRPSILLSRLLNRVIPPRLFLGSIASIVGIAGGMNSMGLFGGGGSSAPNPSAYMYYDPATQKQASDMWLNLMGGLNTDNSQFRDMTRNPIMGGLTSALGTDKSGLESLIPMLRGSYGNIASADQLYAGLLGQQGQTNMSALTKGGIDTYLAALDPQQGMHDKLLQRIVDQSGAGQAQRGIQMGGAGQGMTDTAVGDFESNWSNQLLGRQVQGLTAMEQALGAASQTGQNNFGAAAGLYGQMPAALTGMQTAPQTAAGLDMNFLNSIIGGYGGLFQNTQVSPFQQMQNQIVPFLSGGQGAGADAFGGAMKAFGANQQVGSNAWNAILTGAKGLSDTGGGNMGQWLSGMWGNNSPGLPAQNGGAGASSPTWNNAMWSE